jgi:hypothetical protein
MGFLSQKLNLLLQWLPGGSNVIKSPDCVGLHPMEKGRSIAYVYSDSDGKHMPSKLKETPMHLLFSLLPVLANVYYIGGGAGFIVLIIVIVLILR